MAGDAGRGESAKAIRYAVIVASFSRCRQLASDRAERDLIDEKLPRQKLPILIVHRRSSLADDVIVGYSPRQRLDCRLVE